MRGIITAAIRIILIFFFFQVINQIIIFFQSIFYTPPDYYEEYMLQVVLIPIAIFLSILLAIMVVWWKADTIALWLLGNSIDTQIVINTTNTELTKVILRVFGICLICLSIPVILGHIAYYFQFQSQIADDYPVIQSSAPPFVSYFVTDVVKILISLWLILGSRGIVTAINKIWDAAHMSSSKDDFPESCPEKINNIDNGNSSDENNPDHTELK
jgi:hypothetical protein